MGHAPLPARRIKNRLSSILFAGFLGMFVSAANGQATAPASAPASQPAQPLRTGDTEVRFNAARVAYYDGHFKEAASNFRGVIEANPADAEAHHGLGLALLEDDQADAALPEFDESLRLDPGLTVAHSGRAAALIRLKRLDEAQQEVAILQADPGWKSTGDFLNGQIAFAKGDYAGASKSFAAAKEAGGPDAGPAGFYEGLTLVQLRDLGAARNAFRQAAAIEPNSSLALASRQLDSLLASGTKDDKRFKAELQLGYEYDSNVVLLDTGIQLPGNISSKDDGRIIVQPHVSYSFIKNEKWEAGIDTTNYFAWQSELSDFDIASYDVGAYLNYQIHKNLYAGVRYDFNFIELGHDPFLKRNVVTPQLTLLEPKFGYTSVFYQFEARQFDETGGTPELDRDGKNNIVGIVQGMEIPSFFPSTGSAGLEASYRYENQATKGSDFDGNFHTLGLTYRTPLPFWKLKADAGVAVAFEDYSHDNSLDASGRRRSDFEMRTLVGITKDICEHAAVRIDYAYTNHDSNVQTTAGDNPYEYDRHVVGIRLILTY